VEVSIVFYTPGSYVSLRESTMKNGSNRTVFALRKEGCS
jgi:hypothetical protein